MERRTGAGTQTALRATYIPIRAQVVSLADVYDALTSERVYKAAYTHAQAVSMILNGECGVFNPRLLNSFLSVASRLENGEIGPDVQGNGRPHPRSLRTKRIPFFSPDLVAAESVNAQNTASFPNFQGDIVFNYDVKRDMLECSEKWYEVLGWDITVPNARKTLLRSSFIHEDDRAIVLKGLSGNRAESAPCCATGDPAYDLRGRLRMVRRGNANALLGCRFRQQDRLSREADQHQRNGSAK